MRHNTIRIFSFIATTALVAAGLPAIASATPAATKHLNRDGSVPKKWDLPTPELVSDDSTPNAAGGDGDGSNTIPLAHFDDGDFLCAFDTVSTGHSGVWKDSLYTSISSFCVWSANTTPTKNVHRERASKYREYDYCYGEWVPTKAAYGPAVVNWCAAQEGEPYDLSSPKTDYSEWYCSKLVWAGWKVKAGVDLDSNGGYWVKPADLVNDSQSSTFAYGD